MLKNIEQKAQEIINKFNLDKEDIMDTLSVAGIFVIAYVVYKLWKKSKVGGAK